MKISKLIILTIAFSTLFSCDLVQNDCNDNEEDHENSKESIIVPTNLLDAFASTYPNATNVEWEKEDLEYEVEFTNSKKEMEVKYNLEGKTLETETKLTSISDIPQVAQDYIARNYVGYKIEEAELVVNSENTTFYEIELDQNDNDDIEDENDENIEEDNDEENNNENGNINDEDHQDEIELLFDSEGSFLKIN